MPELEESYTFAEPDMVAVRPPEYFPGLETFALMDEVKVFALADTFQYSRQSFQNRTKVRNPQGWQWVSVPLKGGQHGRPVAEVMIRQVPGWLSRHARAFEYNYRSTAFFEYYEAAFAPLFRQPWTRLADLTCASVELIHGLLGLSTTLVRASTLPGGPSDLPGVLDRLDCDALLAPAATARHDAQAAPSLRVLHYESPRYRQAFDGFEPGMTALDLLFNYGPEARSILRGGICIEAFAG